MESYAAGYIIPSVLVGAVIGLVENSVKGPCYGVSHGVCSTVSMIAAGVLMGDNMFVASMGMNSLFCALRVLPEMQQLRVDLCNSRD